jgi:hypothetical protein
MDNLTTSKTPMNIFYSLIKTPASAIAEFYPAIPLKGIMHGVGQSEISRSRFPQKWPSQSHHNSFYYNHVFYLFPID